MKALLVSLLLLGAAPESPAPSLPAEALAAPPVADESPTAWACTIDTLRAGKECVFEAEAVSAQSDGQQENANRKLLQDVGRALCSEAVGNARDGRPDKTLTTLCERRYSTAVDACGIDGAAPVVDSKGRFAPTARSCYRALSSVLQEVQLMATVSASCCECAARANCPGSGDRCYADIARQEAGPATLECLSNRCADACSLTLPGSASSPRPATPGRDRRTASRSPSGNSL